MPTDSDMPESWNRNANGGRSNEITAAILRAREARATQEAPARLDELAQRRNARRAAEDARRRMLPSDLPPGPRTA